MLEALNEFMEDKQREARNEGRNEGRNSLNHIYANLLNNGRNDDVIRAIHDPEYLKKIMAEFGIDDTPNREDVNTAPPTTL